MDGSGSFLSHCLSFTAPHKILCWVLLLLHIHMFPLKKNLKKEKKPERSTVNYISAVKLGTSLLVVKLAK